MPNHVTNIVNFTGDKEKIAEMLEAIKDDEYGLGTIDFNKITPMPESLKITAGSQTERGLEYYKAFSIFPKKVKRCFYAQEPTLMKKPSL